MQKLFFVLGMANYGKGQSNPYLDEINNYLSDGWEVKSITGAPYSDNAPVFAVVLEKL